MASETERNALKNVLKGKLIDSFRIFEKTVIGAGGITVIMHMN